MRRESFYLLEVVIWFLLVTAGDVPPNTNQNHNPHQNPSIPNPCELGCLCRASPVCWNQLPCCPESFGRMALVDPFGELSAGVMGNPAAEENLALDLGSPVRERRSPVREQESRTGKRESPLRERRNPVTQRRQNASCLYPMIYGEPLLDEFKDRFQHRMFRMIHDCLDKYIGSDLQQNCLDFRNTSSLENIIPVADSQTRTVFANRFCAVCSGIQEFNEFRVEFICDSKILDEWELLSLERTHENQLRLIKTGLCVYYFRPTGLGIEIPENQCMAVKYKDCNQTGDAIVLSVDNWHLCDWKGWFQDNNYCALCDDRIYPTNQSDHNRLLKHCDARCHRDIPFVMSVSFFALMSLDRSLLTANDDRVQEPRDQRCRNQSGDVYDQHTNVCRRILCPVFHVLKGHECYPVNSGFLTSIPKLATIWFREINRTDKLHDPYINFEENVLHIVKDKILWGVFELSPKRPTGGYQEMSQQATILYLKFYQKEGVYESDFILEFAWLSGEGEEYFPNIFEQLFNKMNLSIPLPHTSTLFEAKSITNFYPHGDNVTISHSVYSLIYPQENKEHVETRYLPMSRLILCKRVSLSLSEFTRSTGYLYHHSGTAINIPDDHMFTGNAIELCAEDYFNQTSIMMESTDVTDGTLHAIAAILSFACSCVSIVCLLITVVTYLLFEPLRTTPGKINLCLCVSLLIAQILQQFTMDLIKYRMVCIICGAFIHFTWSVTMCWMNVSSFNLFRCFSPVNLGRRDFQPSLALYGVYVISMSALLVVANMGYSFLLYGNIGYGKRLCYISSISGLLITFVTPVGVIVLANLCFLLVTMWRISHTPKPEGSKSADRSNVVIYIKMSTLTGSCWIFGFLRILTELDVFEILFILANASQGLFIMISFICNRRVMAFFKEMVPYANKRGTVNSTCESGQ